MRSRLIGSVALAALVVAGCSGTSVGGQTKEKSGAGKVHGSISFAWWGGASRNEKTNAVIDLYKKAHPGVEVDTQSADFTAYFEKLNVQAAGGNLPCIPQMQARQLGDYTKRRVLLPLDSMVKSGKIDVSGIPKNVLNTGRGKDGKLYMVPYGAAYDGIMYNSTMAKKAGLPEPPANFSWDWWAHWLMEAKSKLPSGVSAASLDAGNADLFISYVQSRGGSLLSGKGLGFDKSMLTDYWSMWEKLRKAGATVSASTQADEGTSTPLEEGDMARAKVMSASEPGNALVDAQDALNGHGGGRLKMTTHPSGPSGLGNVVITSGLSISGSCDNVPTAASFIDFFTNNAEGAKTFDSDNGAVTVSKLLDEQLNNPKADPQKTEELQVYQQIVKSKGPAVLYPPGYQTIFEDAFIRYYQDLSFGKKSLSDAVNGFFDEAEGELTK